MKAAILSGLIALVLGLTMTNQVQAQPAGLPAPTTRAKPEEASSLCSLGRQRVSWFAANHYRRSSASSSPCMDIFRALLEVEEAERRELIARLEG